MTEHKVPLEIGVLRRRTFSGSFKVDPELWSQFKGECKFRGVSICHVIEALMEAWIQGQKATATVIKPVTVNLTMQHIVERPRRKIKFDPIMLSTKRCHTCNSSDISEMVNMDGTFVEGSCKHCGANWLRTLTPGS